MKIRIILCVFCVLCGWGLSAWGQAFDGTIRVQAIANSFTGTDVSRTAYPVGFPETFVQGELTSTSTLGLTGMGVTAGQFKVTANWPDGSIKAIWADALVNYTAGGPNNNLALSLTGGSGNFGGSTLAVDNAKISGSSCEAAGTSSGYICVNTGAAQFQIVKANFNVFDKVVVNGKVLVDSAVRASEGLVVMGPPSANGTNAVPNAPAASPTIGTTPCTHGTAGCPTASRTYVVKTAYVSASGESLPSPASSSTVVPLDTLLQVTCPSAPPSGPSAAGCYVYVGSSATALHLQQATGKPLSLGATWTEPLGCKVTLRDDSTTSIQQSNCQGTGGVLNGTQLPQSYAVSGNSGCLLGSCSTPYKSSLDSNSTAVIEENGPAKALIKATGSYASSAKSCPVGADVSGNETVGCYRHYTQRMYFFKGQTWGKLETIDRNADYTPSSTGNETHPASDARGQQSEEIRIALAGADVDGGAKTYTFKANATNTDCASQLCTGTLSGDAMLYQAYHPLYERYEQNGRTLSEYNPPLLSYQNGVKVDSGDGSSNGRKSYAQEGYVIQANGSVVTSRNADIDRHHPQAEVADMGWADIKDTNGRGIQIGIWNLAAAYPGSLKFKQITSNTYDAVIGLMPDQTEPLATASINPQGAIAYYICWPCYQIRETFWNFHDVALSNANASFQAYQQFLRGRPALSDFNRSQFFTEIYPLIEPSVFDGYLVNTVGGSMASWTPPAPSDDLSLQWWIRAWDPRQSGEGNQSEVAWSRMMNWLQRGGEFATSYLYAKMYYRQQITNALPRADFLGGWRGTCTTSCPALDRVGFPQVPAGGNGGAGKYPTGNRYYASRDWNNDAEHMHIFGLGEFAILSGDPTMMDGANQAWTDAAANPVVSNVKNCPSPGPCYLYSRSLGWALGLSAHAFTYLNSQGNSTDANNARTKASNIMDHELPLTAYGYGFGSQQKGQSPITGLIWNGSYDDNSTANGDDSTCPSDTSGSCSATSPYGGGGGYRIATSFFMNAVIQSLFDSLEAYGSSWANYQKALDQLSGAGAGVFAEGIWQERNRTTGCITSIKQNIPACSSSTANPGCYPGNPCSGALYWQNMEFYNADKLYALGHNVPNSNYFLFLTPVLLTGQPDISFLDPVDQTVNVRNAFHEYLQLRGPGRGAEDGAEEWSSTIGAFLSTPLTKFTWKNLSGNPVTPGGHWIDVNFTGPVACSGQSYCTLTGASPGNLTWSAPTSVVAYRMKMNPDAKQIVDWVRLDNVTNPHADGSGCASRYTSTAESGGPAGIAPDTVSGASSYADGHWWYGCWIDDPRVKWPWFSSAEVPISGTPTSFDPTTASGYSAAGSNTFALRAYVTSDVPTAWMTATPSTISSGGSSTLNWTTTNVTAASIDQGIGTVALTGSQVVTPASTTTYTLTATGPNGTATASTTVVVTAPPTAPTAAITVTPATINVGSSATLSWATTDADISVNIDPGIGSVAASGSQSVTPAATTTYVITAVGTGGTATDQVTLTVIPAPPAGGNTTVVKGVTVKGAKIQ